MKIKYKWLLSHPESFNFLIFLQNNLHREFMIYSLNNNDKKICHTRKSSQG